MKKVVILFFFIQSFKVTAGPFDKKLLFGPSGSLEYSYRFLKCDDYLNWLKDVRDKNEGPIPGFSAAFHFQVKVSKHFYTDFSLALIRKGYCTTKENLVYGQQEPGAPVNIHYRYTTGCLELPVNLHFHPVDSGAFFFSLGIAPVLPVIERRKAFLGYANGSTDTKADASFGGVENFSLAAYAGVGYYFSLGKNMFLQLKPFYRCNILNGNQKEIKEYYYAFGLDAGLFFSR